MDADQHVTLRPITWGSGLRLTAAETRLAVQLADLPPVRREAVIFLATATGVVVDGRRARRAGKPSTLAPPWIALADACGGVAGLALAVGVSTRTVHRWGHGATLGEAHAAAVRELAERRGVESPV